MEIKQEIAQIVEGLPNDKLNEVLNYLRQIEKEAHEKAQLSAHLQTILIEDKELLEKLAQ